MKKGPKLHAFCLHDPMCTPAPMYTTLTCVRWAVCIGSKLFLCSQQSYFGLICVQLTCVCSPSPLCAHAPVPLVQALAHAAPLSHVQRMVTHAGEVAAKLSGTAPPPQAQALTPATPSTGTPAPSAPAKQQSEQEREGLAAHGSCMSALGLSAAADSSSATQRGPIAAAAAASSSPLAPASSASPLQPSSDAASAIAKKTPSVSKRRVDLSQFLSGALDRRPAAPTPTPTRAAAEAATAPIPKGPAWGALPQAHSTASVAVSPLAHTAGTPAAAGGVAGAAGGTAAVGGGGVTAAVHAALPAGGLRQLFEAAAHDKDRRRDKERLPTSSSIMPAASSISSASALQLPPSRPQSLGLVLAGGGSGSSSMGMLGVVGSGGGSGASGMCGASGSGTLSLGDFITLKPSKKAAVAAAAAASAAAASSARGGSVAVAVPLAAWGGAGAGAVGAAPAPSAAATAASLKDIQVGGTCWTGWEWTLFGHAQTCSVLSHIMC